MAQKILLRRGGLVNLNSGATIAVSKGEQLLGSGSLANTNIGDITFVANADGNGTFVAVGRIFSGTAAANSFDSKLNGLPYYKTDEQALYKLGDANALDLSGNLEGSTISDLTATGSFSGSFTGDGSGLTNLALGSISAPGSNTQVLFNDNGSIGASSNLTLDGSVLDMNGTISGSDLYLSGDANIVGSITLGGNIIIGDAPTDTVNFGGEVTSNIVPELHDSYDLGIDAQRWRNLFVSKVSGSSADFSGDVSADNLTLAGSISATGGITGSDVQIDDWGSVSASLASLNSGANAITLADVTANGATTTEDVTVNNLTITNIAAGTDNTVVILSGSNLLATDEIDGRVWGATLVGTTGTPANNQLAIFTDANTVEGVSDVTYDGSTLTIAGDIDSDDITIDDWGSVSASLAAINSGANALTLQDVTDQGATTTNEITTAGVTAGNVKVGVTTDNTIDTSTGNLTINSTGGTVTIDDNLVVSGDLTVSGTRTIVNSTEVNIDDNIIVLNAAGGVADGGINVVDAVSTAGTGSLLWNATDDYWYAGLSGSTHYRLATFTNQTPTSDKITRVDSNKRLVASSLSDNGSAVSSSVDISMEGNNITNLGSLGITGLTANAFVHTNASKVITTVAPSTAGDIFQWNGTAFIASNVIDGGTF